MVKPRGTAHTLEVVSPARVIPIIVQLDFMGQSEIDEVDWVGILTPSDQDILGPDVIVNDAVVVDPLQPDLKAEMPTLESKGWCTKARQGKMGASSARQDAKMRTGTWARWGQREGVISWND